MEFTGVLVLVVTFVVLLGMGVPIVYSIGTATVATMMVTMMPMPALTTVSQRMATGLNSFALLAIPFFVFAGLLMNRGGIAHRLIDFAKVLVGRLPGGLAYVNVIAAMLFGAISGSAVAAASAIGGFMSKQMEDEGYDKAYSASVNITASSTGMIIPPSNILIVYSLASGGASIAALFVAGYLPGILLGLLLMSVAGVIAYKRGYRAGGKEQMSGAFRKFLNAIPSILLIIIIIGGIISGIFTATEASAVAVLYTLVLSMAIYKEVKWKDLPEIMLETVQTTAVVMFLIGASVGMSWVMSYENIPQTVSNALINLSDNPMVILFIINILLLFVGTFMDMTPAVLIFTPIFLPIVKELGMDPIHFGIMMVANLCVGLCTPPVGTLLFVGCGVADLSISKVIRPMIPFFVAMFFALLAITYIPELTMWLPGVFDLLSK